MPAFESVVPALARALASRGFETLTPVQVAVVEPALQHSDLIVSAQTGSGKTVAFGLTLGTTLLNGNACLGRADAPLALIIAPTRELAMQVRGELEWLFAEAGGRITSCVGGMDMREERRALSQGAHIVVGTPGRLADHIRRGSLPLTALKAVVLDEADEMLKLGFREELELILEACPADRRTLMFSATMPRAIEALANRYQRDAERVNTVNTREQHADIEYRALVTAAHDTETAIFNVLRYYNPTNALVFCGTRAAVTRLSSRLSDRGLAVATLSGELSQNERTKALKAMRDGRAQVCVATDVAARGIDLPDLELVVHADLPRNTEALLHRSGRTGRAGRKGASILMIPHAARRRADRLLRDAGVQASWGAPPSADDIIRRDDQRLLSDPILEAQPSAAEQDIVGALLAHHTPAQIAAAFVRLHRKGQAAPEDLPPPQAMSEEREKPTRAARSRDRETFERGVWLSLSVGRTQSAEPRWLIPMICKAGGITKQQIGAIRIQQTETHFEIDAAIVDEFLARIGPSGQLEKTIRVTRLDQTPRGQGSSRPKHNAGAPHAHRAGQREGKPAKRASNAPHDPKAGRKQAKAKHANTAKKQKRRARD